MSFKYGDWRVQRHVIFEKSWIDFVGIRWVKVLIDIICWK